MVRRLIAPAGFAAVLLFASTAFADGERESVKTVKDAEHRIEHLDGTMDLSRRGPARADRGAADRHRHTARSANLRSHHQTAYRRWNGGYGLYPRRHVFVVDASPYGLPGPVGVAAYRSYLYYTPAYPSVSYGYPPYVRLYDLTPGPIYNTPCFC